MRDNYVYMYIYMYIMIVHLYNSQSLLLIQVVWVADQTSLCLIPNFWQSLVYTPINFITTFYQRIYSPNPMSLSYKMHSYMYLYLSL